MIESHLRFRNLTVHRTMIPSTQDCVVCKLDSHIPVPERMEFDMKKAMNSNLEDVPFRKCLAYTSFYDYFAEMQNKS